MLNQNIDGSQFFNMVVNASNKLEQQKEYVNSLNVFPVPDGDTGTNMSMTFKAAVNEIQGMKDENIGDIAKKLSRGALMGARGNSGVILSQIFRGIAKGLEDKEMASAEDIANSLKEGATYAYKAVMRPTEGTILTVIREVGEYAVSYDTEDILDLMGNVCLYGEEILNKTPDMLPALKEAKVVDAGGMGMLILLKGMHEALKYNIEGELIEDIEEETTEGSVVQAKTNTEDIEFGYCTEFFVISEKVDIDAFKNELMRVGDSVVVVGLDNIVKVHVHTNDPGHILSQAVKMGELSKIKIENMREQHRSLLGLEDTAAEEEKSESKPYGFIAVARGEGIETIFNDLGVDHVIEGGQTMNPSTQDILDSINKVNAETIFILPNNKNIMMAAEQAAEISEKNVVVIPTKTIPQGIGALSVFNAEDNIDSNVEGMKETIDNIQTGSITYAVKDTESDGIQIKENDILGLVEGKISEVGKNKFEVCEAVIEKMTDDFSELITIYFGEDCDENEVNDFVEKLEEKYPEIDIESYNGKQPLYYFIVSVE